MYVDAKQEPESPIYAPNAPIATNDNPRHTARNLFLAGHRKLVSAAPPGSPVKAGTQLAAQEGNLGKIPSIKDETTCEWFGYNWRKYVVTLADAERMDRDLANIGIVAGKESGVVFVDLDTRCRSESDWWLHRFAPVLPGAPQRWKNDRVALLATINGPAYGKRVFPFFLPGGSTPVSKIEVLAEGQQAIVHGEAGGRYTDQYGNPFGDALATIPRDSISRLSLEQIDGIEEAAYEFAAAHGLEYRPAGNAHKSPDHSTIDQSALRAPDLDAAHELISLLPIPEVYDDWVYDAACIRGSFGDDSRGESLFVERSLQQSRPHPESEIRSKYRGFRRVSKGWDDVLVSARFAGIDTSPYAKSEFDEITLPAVAGDVPTPPSPHPAYRSLRDLMSDPALLAPPVAVLSRLAYRGRTTLLSAREKFGKSTILRGGAAAVSNGLAFLDDTCEQGTVLWCGEENVGDMVRAFSDLGANPDAIYVLDLRSFGKNRIDEVCGAIATLRPSLVIIDTLISLTAGIVLDSSKDSQITPIISRIAGLAARLNCACLLSHHSTKSGSGYHGSMAYGALVDCLLELKAPGDDPTSPIRRVSGMGRWPVEDLTLRFNSASRTYALFNAMTPLDRARIFIRANPGCTKSQLQKELSLRSEAVSRLRSELIASGIVRDVGAGRNWALELDHAADFDENLGDTLVDGAPFVPREKKPAVTRPAARTAPTQPIPAPVATTRPDVPDPGTAPPSPSSEDVRAAINALALAKGDGAGRALLTDFSVPHVSRLSPERYADFVAKANAAAL